MVVVFPLLLLSRTNWVGFRVGDGDEDGDGKD